MFINDVWMAFYAESDYAKKSVEYSDVNDVVDITHYQLTIDLRDVRKQMGLVARMDMKVRAPST